MTTFFVAFLVNTLLFCNGFVLMSSVPAGSYGELKLFQNPLAYTVESTVFLNDVNSVDKEVGYKILGKLTVDPIWEKSDNVFLLKFELQNPKLHVTPKGSLRGYIEHKSLLDSYKNEPFFVSWRNGVIEKVYISNQEEPSLVNFKKGLLSVFQFQILDGEHNETDVSGNCDVFFHTVSSTVIRKFKKNCISQNEPAKKDGRILQTTTDSHRLTKYTFTDDLTALKQIYSEELHHVRVSMKQDIGNKARVWLDLKLQDSNLVTDPLKAERLEDAIQEAEAKYGIIFKAQTLEVDALEVKKDESGNLAKILKENRDLLKAEHLGSEKSAVVFLNVLKAMREAKSDEILKSLKGVKNKEILQQICDIMGYSQTYEAHKAAKSFLNFDSDLDRDNVERYLWAISIGPKPNDKVILDILKMSENTKYPEQIQETLLLTASAMSYTLSTIEGDNYLEVSNKVKDSITKNLSKCKENQCYIKSMRALKNLKRQDTVDILLEYSQKNIKPVSVSALKALKAMPKTYWNEKVIKVCLKVFFQKDKKYDSSARTLALDIILEHGPNVLETAELLHFLASTDKDFEVKQLLLQRVEMLVEKCPVFKKHVRMVLGYDRNINNWHVLAPKGISNAISRIVNANTWSNVSLVSVQEVSSGLLKRGHVDVIVETDGVKNELFSLGLFASGLSSMLGSSEDEVEVEEEPMTAGMELTIHGVQIRPFTFFNGQGELMGHVWSGTASERTTAFQAVTLLQDETKKLVLGNGAIADVSLISALSFDLAAQIQISLWNRVAHSVIDENAGISVQGALRVNNPFMILSSDFIVSLEPKLEIETDTDFYNKVSLCVQVKQPDTLFTHKIIKQSTIPKGHHSVRKTKISSYTIPGKTYALNKKNNEMCNAIHNK